MSTTRRSLVALAVVALVAAVVAVVVAVTYTDGDRPGSAYPGISAFDSEHDGQVRLPSGTLKVQVGSPAQEYDTDFDETRTAADGAVFVPVAWTMTGRGTAQTSNGPTFQFQLALVADGRRYDLQAGYTDHPATENDAEAITEGSIAAVVEGEGENLSVEVEYDGLTQTLDVDSGEVDAGLAAPYYARSGLRTLRTSTGCSGVSTDDRTVVALLDDCEVGPVQLVPYVGGLGWVRSASESWATVPYSLQVSSVRSRSGSTQYDIELRRLDLTLDGRAPATDVLRYRHAGSVLVGGVKVFRTSPTPKTLGLTTELVGDPYGAETTTRTFRNVQSFPLR